VFFAPQDRLFFYSLLADGVSRFGFRIHAFCLMNNHVHIAIQPGKTALPKIMQNIAFRYTRQINKQKKRIGHLFQGRYKAILVDENNYLLELVRYIHLNPVRAGVAKNAVDWRWSGHNAYLGKERLDWLTTDAVLGQFGGKLGVARERYDAFIAEGTADATASVLRRGSEGGRILGDDRFVEKTIKSLTKEEKRNDVPFERLVKAVADVLKVSEKNLFSPSRERNLAKARAIVCLLARLHCRITLTEAAKKFGRDEGGMSRAIRRHEKVMEEDEKEKRLVNRIANALVRQVKMSRQTFNRPNKSLSQA